MGLSLHSLEHGFSNIVHDVGGLAKRLTGNVLGIPGLDPALLRGDIGHSSLVTKLALLAGGAYLGGEALGVFGAPSASVGSSAALGSGLTSDLFGSSAALGTGLAGVGDLGTGLAGPVGDLGSGLTPDLSASLGTAGVGDVGTGYGSTSLMTQYMRNLAGNPWLKALGYGSGAISILGGVKALTSKPPVYDPFADQRGQYQAQLSRLASDPSYLTQLPGYQAGLQAVQRSMAANGYLGSGNMMLALQDYGNKTYQDEFARLSAAAGANIGPMNTVDQRQVGLEDIGRGLASIGFMAAI